MNEVKGRPRDGPGYVRKGREQKVEQVIKEVLEPHDGELFTQELIAVLAQRLASAFLPHVRR